MAPPNTIPTRYVPYPIPAGSLVNNDFTSGSWTYSGSGSATFNASDITMVGGGSSIATTLRYTAMPTALKAATTTARFEMTNVDASNGVVGLGVVSNNPNNASLRHFVLVNCRTGVSKGNVLMYYNNAFDSETQPTVIPFTNGDTIEIKLIQTLLTLTWQVRNVTRSSAVVQISKTLSVTYLVGAQNIPDVVDLTVFNYSGTNKMTYFDYSTTEYKYADMFHIGTSKVDYFYTTTQPNGYSDLWSAATGKKSVNVGAQACKLAQFKLLIPLMIKMRPKKVYMADVLRNNNNGSAVVLSTQDKADFQSIVSAAISIGADVWYNLAIPEAVLDQSAGNAYIISVAPANRITGTISPWNPAAGQDTSDGTHPNIPGNVKWKNNMLLYNM